jgi:hypothetical protein
LEIENSVGGVFGLTAGINGLGTEAGRAYITQPVYIGSATYESNSPTDVILRSPLLNGAGKNVTVSFDWEAGGKQCTETFFMIMVNCI